MKTPLIPYIDLIENYEPKTLPPVSAPTPLPSESPTVFAPHEDAITNYKLKLYLRDFHEEIERIKYSLYRL